VTSPRPPSMNLKAVIFPSSLSLVMNPLLSRALVSPLMFEMKYDLDAGSARKLCGDSNPLTCRAQAHEQVKSTPTAPARASPKLRRRLGRLRTLSRLVVEIINEGIAQKIV